MRLTCIIGAGGCAFAAVAVGLVAASGAPTEERLRIYLEDFVLEIPAPESPSVATVAVCPDLVDVDPPWSPGAEASGSVAKMLPIPTGMERRVKFWEEVWGEHPDRVFLIVDRRRPWVVFGGVDCEDLFSEDASEADLSEAHAKCRNRVSARLMTVRQDLRRHRAEPSEAMSRTYGGNTRLARTAHANLRLVQGRKDALARAMDRGMPHLDEIQTIFAANGVPPILSRLAVVESLFATRTVSRSAAVGAFQFLAPTAREFLTVDASVDERADPIRSAWAAARYLAQIESGFGDWGLAITAYNTGPTRLRRVMRRHGVSDLGSLVKYDAVDGFGFDGQNHYAQLLAVARLTADMEPPARVPRAHVRNDDSRPLEELADCLDITVDELLRANPAVVSGAAGGGLLVPVEYVWTVPSAAVSRPVEGHPVELAELIHGPGSNGS